MVSNNPLRCFFLFGRGVSEVVDCRLIFACKIQVTSKYSVSCIARFPHNYVGSTFKPLPGIHEMAAKLRERREKLEAAQDRAGKLAWK